MHRYLSFIALILVLCFLLCSCGGETIVTSSEYFVYEGDEELEDFDSESETSTSSSNTSSDKINTNVSSVNKDDDVSDTSSKKKPVSSEAENDDEFNYADHYTELSQGKNKAIIYSAPQNYDTFDFYMVEVNIGNQWFSVPVYNAEVMRSDKPVQNTYFASFDLSGTATVKIVPKYEYSTFEINPSQDVKDVKESKRFITFEVTPGDQLSIEFDDDIMSNLQLFVNPIDNNIPSENDSKVLFVKPGVYTYQNCDFIKKDSDRTKPYISLKSNQTLYLCGGAVVKAEIVIGEGVTKAKVRGRGIIDLLDYNTKNGGMDETNGVFGFRCTGINLSRCVNPTIEGVIIKNAAAYGIMGNGVTSANIDNVKIFSKGECTDGIDFVASSYINIKNCFLRTNDDGIAVYASRWGYNGGASCWNVDNCVFLMDCAHAINIGTHGSQDANNRDEICDMKFSNIDIIDVFENSSYYWGAIAFNIGDENYCHDIEFENIRMNYLTKSMPFMIAVKKDSGFNPNAGYRLENIKFKNITLTGSMFNKSKIYGYDDSHYVNNVSFENLTISGTKVINSNRDKYFEVGDFVRNLSFK